MIGHLTRGGLVLAMLGLFMVLPTAMPTAQANPIVADLSKDHISIRSNFVGEQLLLFGALAETPDGPIDDIIVVMRGPDETFTVRKVSFQVGVERTFPVHSPVLEKIELVSKGDVRRAKLYYLRNLRGKAAKIREKRENA